MESSTSITSKQAENRSSVLINATIFKLVETIEKKIKAGHADKDLDELRLLREQCGSENPLVSVTACHGLVCLVKGSRECLSINKTISALVASLFSIKSVTGVTSALTELLVYELKCQLSTNMDSSQCFPTYNTRSPQHPLVSVLKRRSTAWPDVLNQVSTVCCHPDKLIQSHSLELVKPVFDYILMESNDLPESCRFQTFRIIIDYFSNTDYLLEALAYCLCWNVSRVLEMVQLVSALAQSAISAKHGLYVSISCLSLATLLPRLLQASLSPQPVLQLLSQLSAIATNTHSTLLAVLSDCIPTCPAVYLEHLLTFFVELLSRNQCSVECVWMCVSGLLPWLASSPGHLHQALHTASLILSHASTATASPSVTATLISSSAVATVVSADPKLMQAILIARLNEVLRNDSAATLSWLQTNKCIELDTVHLYVSALLLCRPEPAVRLAALEVLSASRAPLATSHNLTLFLYQLAREKQPDNQLALIRALPALAVDKNNVLGVVSTLEALRRSGSPNLSLLSVQLYCQLWLSQERCYPQLMSVLEQDCAQCHEPWLAYTLQASICKTICQTKPELHGKEVVAKVSDILNRCSGVKEGAAAALALDALVPLCQNDVVDVYTIWRSLAPRFTRDKRPPVLKSLCELVSVAAVQKTTTGDADSSLTHMLTWLWNIVGTNKNTSVVHSTFMALSKFRVDQMTLKMLPECFRKNIKLPPEMIKTPADAARKPEDVLDYIPGECWVQVLQHIGNESASLAVGSWIKMEITAIRGSSLYQVDKQEPMSYSHLPQRSVVRGVTTSLQQLVDSGENHSVVNLCLIALLQPTPKPLPSLNWAFLLPLITDPATPLNLNMTRLAAKQAQISPSARKIIESSIASSGEDNEKIQFLYSILSDLCRGIPPNILRPFLERTLQIALNKKDNEHLSMLFSSLRATMKEEKIHDANRNLLHQQVRALWDLIDPQHKLLTEYFECVSELPVSVIESVTSTSLMWEVTSVQLQKAFRLRAFMALLPSAPQPLNWLNEIIDVASSNISEQALALQLVTEVMTQLSRHPSAWPWLQELMGQTHLTSKENKSGVEFLVSVYILCVDIMSGYSGLSLAQEDSRALRFPQAVASLVTQHGEWKAVLEWLNHMKGFDSFPAQFSAHFQLAARNVLLTTS